ncbi:MAG: DNA-3-methyladenine glycosylase I [Kurthia sp.]|nr:DNA-3-methyladenine glycosylase I [Candidatus Kurthia equi]
MVRCSWANSSALDQAYHDEEWGVPLTDDRDWFETLILESMQAGLSWSIILKKRQAMREAFDAFDYEKISLYTEEKIEELLLNPGIIRHRGKIKALISNAQCFIEIQKEFGSFSDYLWAFIGGKPIHNHLQSVADIPVTTELSLQLAKELKKRGFKFLGPTTVYAFMQASGLVNDHVKDCFKYSE